MSDTILDQIIEASEMIKQHMPEEMVVVLGSNAYTLLNHHVKSVFIHSKNKFVNMMNGTECHVTFIIPKNDYMIITREEFIKFQEAEQAVKDKVQNQLDKIEN